MKKLNIISILCLLLCVGGCAQITETAKTVWGSSTRALENARVDAISKTYRCSLSDCFDAVLSLARDAKVAELVAEPVGEGAFDIFIKNRDKRHIVVMGVEGNVETTEVGIFFSQPTLTTVKLEVSSLSSSAKRKVAQSVFDELDARFSVAN